MIAALLLAAGGSSRLGRPKQLVEVDGMSLVRRAAESVLAVGCRPVIAVVGHRHEEVVGQLDGLEIDTLHHPEWEAGMGTSLAEGARALQAIDLHLSGVLVSVCDQPALTAIVLQRLIDAYDGTAGRCVGSAYAGRVGVPAIFAAELLPRLAERTGDRGARDLLVARPERLVTVSWEEGAFDLDRPQDLPGD